MEKLDANQIKRLFFSIIFFWLALYIHIPYQVLYINKFKITSGMQGLIIGAYGYMQFLLRIPLSILADKMGKQKLLMMTGSIMPGIASLIRLLFDNPMGYFVANIVGGFGAAFWVMFIVEYTRMYSYIMTEKQDASAQINLANQTGILLGYLLSLLFYRENNIKNLLIISIVFSVISCLLISLNRVTPNDNLIKNDLTIKKIATEIINNKNLLRILPIGFLHFGLLSATIQAFSIQRVLLFENNKNIIGFLNLFYIFSTVLFTLLLNNLMQKKSILKIKKFDYKLTIIGLILAIIYHFVYIYVESIVFFLILQIIAGAYSAILATVGIKLALEYVPNYLKNIGMGVYQTAVALGMSIMPPILGNLYDISNFKYTYLFVVGNLFLLIIYILNISRKVENE